MDTCTKCHHVQIRKDAKFCVSCGSVLGSKCISCNTRHPYGKKICSQCDQILFSLFEHKGRGERKGGEGEAVVITVNDVKISVVWQRLITDVQHYHEEEINMQKERLQGGEQLKGEVQERRQVQLLEGEAKGRGIEHVQEREQEGEGEPQSRTEITDTTYTDEVYSEDEGEGEEDMFTADAPRSVVSQRQHIINEILTTERDYMNDLDYIIEVFIDGLKAERFITPAEISSIFSNVESIRDVNYALFRYLQNAEDCPSVPQAFMLTVDKMKLYGTYCSNLEKALETVAQLSKTKPLFASFLLNCKNRKDSRSLDLNSWLIKPLQRLCKYPLLLKQLQQSTSPSEPEHVVLTTATQKMEELVANVNSYKKDVESKKKAAELSQKLEGADVLHLMEPGRYFIQEGPVLLHPKEKGHYHLFSDLLILSKKKRVEDSIALDWCCVRSKAISNTPVLEISHLGVRTWNFLFESDAENIMFVKKMTELIDKAMAKAYQRYSQLMDDSNPPMEYTQWREERENIPCGKSPQTRRRSGSRLSGLFKLGAS